MIVSRMKDGGRRNAKATGAYIDRNKNHVGHADAECPGPDHLVQYRLGNVSNAEEFSFIAEHFNPKINVPCRHYIFSPEPGDRPLDIADFHRMAETFLEERGAPANTMWKAAVHCDGHDGRHAQHMHLLVGAYTPDGQRVPDSFDKFPTQAAARRIEKELGLTPNACPSGRPERAKSLDPALLQNLARRSSNTHDFVRRCGRNGIHARTMRHGKTGEIYGVQFRLDGSKDWVAGGKISESLRFGNLKKEYGSAQSGATKTRAGRAGALLMGAGAGRDQPKSAQQAEDARQQAAGASAARKLFSSNPFSSTKQEPSMPTTPPPPRADAWAETSDELKRKSDAKKKETDRRDRERREQTMQKQSDAVDARRMRSRAYERP